MYNARTVYATLIYLSDKQEREDYDLPTATAHVVPDDRRTNNSV